MGCWELSSYRQWRLIKVTLRKTSRGAPKTATSRKEVRCRPSLSLTSRVLTLETTSETSVAS
eukprot:1104161-Rhodomonas_salina.1